jgi:hypothetical protein
MMMMKVFCLFVMIFCLIIFVNGSKKSRMTPTGRYLFIERRKLMFSFLEIKDCYDKSKNLDTGCDFIKCFHERYQCNDESVTAWAYELCQQFPKEIIFRFTPQVNPSTKFLNFISFLFLKRDNA